MQAKEFINYIKNPNSLEKDSVKELQKLVNDFPYFQSAHLLLSLASKKWDASVYQKSLKKTAIVVTNRSHLFNLIQQFDLSNSVIEDSDHQKLVVEEVLEPVDSTKELNILKATELLIENSDSEISETEFQQKSKLNAEEVLENEIAKQVVSAIVEKQMFNLSDTQLLFKQNKEPKNFTDWLRLIQKSNKQISAENILDTNTENNTDIKTRLEKGKIINQESALNKKLKNLALIDKIIENSPGQIKIKDDQKFYSPEHNAKESLLENEHLVSETLAKIYALQGSVNKAVRAYEILSLKFPQKSAYFASLIQKLKNN
jgi:hypothetical protein